jgi:hypothetical protein
MVKPGNLYPDLLNAFQKELTEYELHRDICVENGIQYLQRKWCTGI